METGARMKPFEILNYEQQLTYVLEIPNVDSLDRLL